MTAPTANDTFGPLFRSVETQGVGIDYLTVTSATPAGKKALVLLWSKYRHQLERLGDNVKKQGFQGYQGEACGPLMFGRREDTFLLKLSSSGALDLFQEIPWAECHCSRIDLQATIKLPLYRRDIAEALASRREAHFAKLNKDISPIQDYHRRPGRGDEMKIGSRESPRYGRIYDKWKESNDERYERCWRWEIEYKGVVAPKIVEFLLQEPHLYGAIIEALVGQFREWKIEIPLAADGVLVAGSVGRRVFDSDRAIRWLQGQVAPTVERLLATVSREEVLAALGLSEPELEQLPAISRAWLGATNQNGQKRTA